MKNKHLCIEKTPFWDVALSAVALGLFFILVSFFVSFSYYATDDTKWMCDKYLSEYGVMTEYHPPTFLEYANGEPFVCNVVMTDGVRVSIDDFNFAMVKTPVMVTHK